MFVTSLSSDQLAYCQMTCGMWFKIKIIATLDKKQTLDYTLNGDYIVQEVKNTMKNSLKDFLKEKLSRKQQIQLQSLYANLLCQGDLKRLSRVYGTDKWTGQLDNNQQDVYTGHYYAQHYETHFRQLRLKKLNILEIGIGGYAIPEAGGSSLRAWRSFFPNSMIYGLDIYDKKFHEDRRIKTFQCSQDDPEALKDVAKTIGNIDIIIDDGSHINSHVIKTFETLFPLLNQNGIYVIEDTLTSYNQGYGGSSENLNLNTTMMGFFKNLIDGINYSEYTIDYEPNYYDKNIVSMHFYHNLIFIYKGENNEPGWNK
jgi:hypothetical protein